MFKLPGLQTIVRTGIAIAIIALAFKFLPVPENVKAFFRI